MTQNFTNQLYTKYNCINQYSDILSNSERYTPLPPQKERFLILSPPTNTLSKSNQNITNSTESTTNHILNSPVVTKSVLETLIQAIIYLSKELFDRQKNILQTNRGTGQSQIGDNLPLRGNQGGQRNNNQFYNIKSLNYRRIFIHLTHRFINTVRR